MSGSWFNPSALYERLMGGDTAATDDLAAYAMVAVMCGAAHADGNVSQDEKTKFGEALKVNPILTGFDRAKAIQKWNDLEQVIKFDLHTGLDACIEEVKKAVAGSDDARRRLIVRMGMAIAGAGNEDANEAERAYLKRVCEACGQSPGSFGLA